MVCSNQKVIDGKGTEMIGARKCDEETGAAVEVDPCIQESRVGCLATEKSPTIKVNGLGKGIISGGKISGVASELSARCID